MNAYSCSPFPRLPPLVSRLSPILEEDEQLEQTLYDLEKTEANNSSQDALDARMFVPDVNSRRISHKEQNLVESSSGRRLEAVEVLKQKYINNDIQDLPRQAKSPVRYGGCYRSRSSRFLAPWPVGIRSQISRLMRRQSVTLGMSSGVDKELREIREINNLFRCKRLDYPLIDMKTEYDTIDQDDFEQELLALMDRPDEDFNTFGCKGDLKITGKDDQKEKNDTFYDDEFTDRRFKDYDSTTESKEAFLRGFLEGLKRSERIGAEMYNKFVDMIGCQELLTEASKDPYLDEGSHFKMIESNQDITHKSLSEWENDKLSAAVEEIAGKVTDKDNENTSSCIKRQHSRHSEPFSRSSSEPKASPVDMITGSHNSKSEEKVVSKSEEKVNKGSSRTLLTLGKTDIHFDIKGNASNKGHVDEEIIQPSQTFEKHAKRPNTSEVPIKTEEGTWSSSRYRLQSDDEERLNTPEKGMCKIVIKPKRKSHKSTAEKIEVASDTFLSSPSAIIQAKQKIACRRDTIAFSADNFDGWLTKHGPFLDQDNIGISSSEILHPVDPYTHFDLHKHEKDEAESPSVQTSANEYNTTCSSVKTSAKSTPRNSPFLRHESLGLSEKNFETNAFKAHRGKSPGKPLMTEIKNKKNSVKLRLTKSSCESPYHKRNIPISRSLSLQNSKKLLSDISITNKINLSEKLANQLQELREENFRQPVSFKNRLSYSRNTLSNQEHNKQERNLVHSDGAKQLNEMHLSLPQIFTTNIHNSGKLTQERENDKMLHPSITDHLPPISGTAILNDKTSNPQEVTDELLINDYQYALRNIPVPARNCTSLLDKENPAHVSVLANSFPRSGILCASCGGIKSISLPDTPGVIEDAFIEEAKPTNHRSDQQFDDRLVNETSAAKLKRKIRQKRQKKKVKHQDKTDSHGREDKKVNIVYKDKHIKLKCEVTVSRTGEEETNAVEGKACRRIDEMAIPRNREKLECPVMKETRIYGKRSRQSNEAGDTDSKDAQTAKTNDFISQSPYLEYCKSRDIMRANKQDTFHEDMANFVSDILIEDLAGKVRNSKGHNFMLPVIPKKRSYDKIKRRDSQENKLCPKSKSLITKPLNDEDEKERFGLSVVPCMLPKLSQK